MTMCTAEEVEKIIHRELSNRQAEFLRKSWYIVIGFAVATASAWYSLYFQVQQIEKTQSSNLIRTKELVAGTQAQIDFLREDYKSDIQDIKEDLKFIREKI